MKRPKQTNASRSGYEAQDVAPRKVVYAGIGLLLGTAISVAFAVGVIAVLPAPAAPAKPDLETVSQEPPSPRLEIDGRADRAVVEDAAAAKLTGYAWIDRSAGTVRIPIERAMELRAARGWSGMERAPAP
jgi:hypothetical protein